MFRQVLIGLVIGMAAPFVHAAGEPPLELVATIPIPDVKGRIDHLDVDLKGHRLFIAALGNNTVEVLDIGANRHAKSIRGFGEPQGLAYLPDSNRLYVANGSAGRVDVIDGSSFAPLKRIAKLDDADNVRYDRAQRTVVVGYGNGALRIVHGETAESAGDIPLSGHPESFQLETNGSGVFVNVPSSGQVAVVDRAKRQVIATWEVPGARENFPMALDEQGRRLFVGTRSPGMLLVYDTDSGKVIAKLPIGGDTDDIFFDPDRRRVYVICGEGRIDIIRADSRDHYASEGSIQTAPRARTGLFVPYDGKLYVAAPAADASAARVLVYQAR
jgi:DNA-binding beta-propeller fold protein YncE